MITYVLQDFWGDKLKASVQFNVNRGNNLYIFLFCSAWWPYLQASGRDLRAACDQSEGRGCKAPPPSNGADQPGAGSGENHLLSTLSFF